MCSLPSVISKFYRKKGQTNQYIDGCYNRCVCVWNIVGGKKGSGYFYLGEAPKGMSKMILIQNFHLTSDY